MQQTTLDLWLRRKFVYVNRIYCNTLPDRLPLGLTVEEAPEESGGRFLYKITTRSEELLKDAVTALQGQNITYTSRVDDRNVWFTKYLNDPHKSFTYRVAWMLIILFILIFAVSGAPQYIWKKLTEEKTEEVVEEKPAGSDQAKVYHKKDGLREIDRK